MKRRKKKIASVDRLVKILAEGKGLRGVLISGTNEKLYLMFNDDCQGDPSQSPSLALIADRLTALATIYGSVAILVVENVASGVSVLQFQGSPQGWRQVPASEVRWKFTAAGLTEGCRFPRFKEVEDSPAASA